jgi:hypothetical protein
MKTEEQASTYACEVLRKHYIRADHPNYSAYDDEYIKRNYLFEYSMFMIGWNYANECRTEPETNESIVLKLKPQLEGLAVSGESMTCVDCGWEGGMGEVDFDTDFDEFKGVDRKRPVCPKCGGGLTF